MSKPIWAFKVFDFHSLKAVVLHNGNQHPSILVAYSTKNEETYANISNLLNKIEYDKYKWEVCADFKMIAILTGMQTGYTKYMCFLCKWDSRATSSHYHIKYFEERKDNIIGDLNVIHESLVAKDMVIHPPLHIKLGIVKNFIKSLNGFKRIQAIIPRLSAAKLQEGMFVGPDIKKLLQDEEFYGALSDMQKVAFEFISLF